VCVCAREFVYACVYVSHACLYLYTHMHAYTYIYIYISCMPILIYIYIYIIYTSIYIQSARQRRGVPQVGGRSRTRRDFLLSEKGPGNCTRPLPSAPEAEEEEEEEQEEILFRD